MCIEDGTYNLGVPVVEREITKLVISQEGQVEQKKIQLRARKYLSLTFGKKLLVKTKNCLELRMMPTMRSFLKMRQLMNLNELMRGQMKTLKR